MGVIAGLAPRKVLACESSTDPTPADGAPLGGPAAYWPFSAAMKAGGSDLI